MDIVAKHVTAGRGESHCRAGRAALPLWGHVVLFFITAILIHTPSRLKQAAVLVAIAVNESRYHEVLDAAEDMKEDKTS